MEFHTINGVGFGVNLARLEIKKKPVGICFFDKDGVIVKDVIRKDGTLGSPRELTDLKFFDGISNIFLNNAENNILNVIVSNQPDIQNDLLDIHVFESMNKVIFSTFMIDCILWCPHSSLQNCDCRKPKIKMFEWAINYFNPLTHDFQFFGDRETDAQAAERINAFFVHIVSDLSLCKNNNHRHIKTLSEFQ